jgi:hypothetical protein
MNKQSMGQLSSAALWTARSSHLDLTASPVVNVEPAACFIFFLFLGLGLLVLSVT